MAEPYNDHRLAARQLLAITTLSEREGQFLGGLCYRAAPLSDKQANWLKFLLERHDINLLDREANNA